MEARFFYFTIHSASNLRDVRKFGRMEVYVKVSMAGTTKCTEVDCPEWNTTLCFTVPKQEIKQAGGKISAKIELFLDDKYVGEYSRVLVPETSSSVDYDRIIELLKAGASLLNAIATVFN
ncbi:hypothetical protein A4A49_54111 [Nicotiana attenuata]|uniref:C2 domain-containing protein n=1 Tax=Nicotiana attenuata TaxID=49451 RepID=A0A1J6I7T2_NICAT|nr:hypothetical protein A4A49_54111 [Nicotiana attenuata]